VYGLLDRPAGRYSTDSPRAEILSGRRGEPSDPGPSSGPDWWSGHFRHVPIYVLNPFSSKREAGPVLRGHAECTTCNLRRVLQCKRELPG
jgi:hypothetical protein